jgi:DNA-binding transcriptional MocR family regulator
MSLVMYSERIQRLTGSLVREILALTQQPGVISFAGGLPGSGAMPPLDLGAVPDSLRQYGTSEGEPELRALLARDIDALGRACTPDQVLITAGSQQGIDLVSKLFIDPGTPVIVEAPSYLAALQSFRLFGARFLTLALSADGIDPQALQRRIAEERPAFVYLIPTFQNPSGYCYTDAVRREVARVLDEAGVPLVEDDPYRELVYTTLTRTPICSYLRRAPWIYLGSFSKTAVPGLRLGFLVASSELYPLLLRLKQAADLHTNRISQWWATRFRSDPGYPAHLARLRARYREQRDAMAAALERDFRDIATWQVPGGGLFFWVRLNQPVDTRTLLQPAIQQGVAFMPGESFFPDDAMEHGWLRMNFSHADSNTIDTGVARLAAVLRGAPRRAAGRR